MKTKTSILLISLVISFGAFSQKIDSGKELYKKIDSLNSEIDKNNEKINFLKLQNTFLEKEIKLARKGIDSVAIYVDKTKFLHSSGVILYEDVERNKRILDIPTNGKVAILEDLGDQYKALYNGKIGYALKYGFYTEKEYRDKEQENIAKAREQEQDRLKSEQEMLQREEARLKREKEEQERIPNLIKKYGSEKGKIIGDGKVRIGFTKQMCIDSWGEPQSINKTTSKYGVNEQWVYGNGNYLYFDDGILTTIQN